MGKKDTDNPSVKGRALVDIPPLGLKSGEYATLSESDFVKFADARVFDTAAIAPDGVVK